MAHYPNDKGEYKTKPITIKWYPSDLVIIDRQAKLLNLTRTDYITKCVLHKPIEKAHVFKVNWRTYRAMGEIARELKRIGNNINQIAKVFNAERLEGGKVPENYPLPEELSAIRSYADRISQELNQVRLLIIGRKEK
ncbi:MAG: MobC family plasmid mobilization relaxosome protein [Pleurocapsa sp. SU_5_0]|nr:MobC family plasmid mobilization relaxosome protein [Pleurocapsa sp. SU_5_0]NJO97902.1 MobC family plasmid mobilization relaxosome protein [Pleurocapsa sp. CRU_1_2]